MFENLEVAGLTLKLQKFFDFGDFTFSRIFSCKLKVCTDQCGVNNRRKRNRKEIVKDGLAPNGSVLLEHHDYHGGTQIDTQRKKEYKKNPKEC